MADIVSIASPVSRLRLKLRAASSKADMEGFKNLFWRECKTMTGDQVGMMRMEALERFIELSRQEA